MQIIEGESSKSFSQEESINFQEMTIKELRDFAEENGIDLGGATKKADIIKVIGG